MLTVPAKQSAITGLIPIQPSALKSAPRIEMHLLGGFRVVRGHGAELVADWHRRSAMTLTKILATCPEHTLHREQVIEILWPRVDVESALNSLAKALHAARRTLEPSRPPRQDSAYLRLSGAMLVLDTENVLVDADQFELRAKEALRFHEVAEYESALSLYSGDLLPEDRYEDWCSARRTYLSEVRMRLLLGLADALEVSGAFNESAERLREILQIDPTREAVHRRLIRLYAEMGTPDQAIRQFRICEEVLKRELDLAPQDETVALYRDLLQNRVPPRLLIREPGLETTEGLPLRDATPVRPFIGRQGIVRHLCDQLTRGGNARSGMALIIGEAGVGKTRLLEELAIAACRQGALTLWGAVGATSNRFACGPLAVALEDFVASRSATEREELANRFPELSSLVPSLAANGQTPRPVGLRDDPDEAVPAIVRLLTDLSSKQPVLIVLGDLHEADPFSLDLVRYLAHLAPRRGWLLVGAARTEELGADPALFQFIDSLTREHLTERIDLECLNRADADHLVRALLPGGEVSKHLAEHIHSRSCGNPLFVEDLINEMVEHGELVLSSGEWSESPGAAWRIPARVRALTASQLASMSPAMRCVLGFTAVKDDADISLEELRSAAAAIDPPIQEAAIFDALDRALASRVIEERGGGYAFRQPLVGAAICAALSRHRHAQLEEALAARNAPSVTLADQRRVQMVRTPVRATEATLPA